MSNNRWTRGLGLLLAASTLAYGMGSAQASPSHAAMDNVTLVLKWVPQAQFGGYFVALDKGYYKQQNLNVKITPGGPDVVPETVVAGGGAQFGIDWLSGLLAARDKGAPLVNVAQIYQASGMRMITFKSSGIDSIAKFKGHKVGVWPAGNEYQFYALMQKVGMSPPKNYMTVVNQLFVMDPFLNHQLDVAQAMTYNELGVVLEHGVKRSALNVFDYNKLGVSVLEDGIMARQDWVKSHSAVAARFLKASIQGWKYAIAHPDEAGQLSYNHAPAASRTQGSLAHQKYMARQVAKLIMYGPGLSHPIGYMDPTAYQRTWQTLLTQKVIHKSPGTAAYSQVYWKAATKGM